jgi:hypothetical protein
LWGMALAGATVVLLIGETPPDDRIDALLRMLDVRAIHVASGFERPEGAVAALREAISGRTGHVPH